MQNTNAIVITDDEKSIISIYSDTDDEPQPPKVVDKKTVDTEDEDFTTDEDEDTYANARRIEEREAKLDIERPYWREEEHYDSLDAVWFIDEDGLEHFKFEGEWLMDYVEGEELHDTLL